MTQEELIRSFHCQWDSFPGLVRLIRRDRTVLAVNRAGEAGGALCGLRCCDQGLTAQHIGCMADRALDGREACWGWNPSGTKLRFWLPLEGTEDCYVHFSLNKEQVTSEEKE